MNKTQFFNNKINLKNICNKNNKHNKKRLCRICYLEEENKENPLVEPCNCSGTMKYIHLNCLKKWISTKSCIKIDSTDNCLIYIIKKIECELCKTILPDYIKYNGKILEILDFHCYFKNYICLESLTSDKHNNRFLYVADLDNKDDIKIGRGHKANLLISDISVSRIHSIIFKEKNVIYIKDNNSKFGTLILIQAPSLKLNDFLNLNIQVGRTFCRIKKIKNFRIFGCCDIEEDKKKLELIYHKQNQKELDIKRGYIIKENIVNEDDDISSYNDKEEENDKLEEEEKNNEIENEDKTTNIYYKLIIPKTNNENNNGNKINSSIINIRRINSKNTTNLCEGNKNDESNSKRNEIINSNEILNNHINNFIINRRNKNKNENNECTKTGLSRETHILEIKNDK
jgi:hypothetical protein